MATSNRERQKRFYESKTKFGDSRIACWLTKEDQQRLRRLMEKLGNETGGKAGYTGVISLALKALEIEMSPPGTKNMVRYGLLYLNDGQINNKRGEQ